MAIDPNPPAAETAAPIVSSIENEIPTYRAISALAVVSAVLGLASFLSFADLWFLIVGALAIVAGFLATRRIRRFPDALTGTGLAQSGIGLGFMTSLSALTVFLVGQFVLGSGAEAFAKDFTKVLNNGKLSDAVWYKLPPKARKGVSPQKGLDDLKKSSRDPAIFQSATGTIQEIHKALAGPPKRHIEFVKIESMGMDRLVPYASALLLVDGPPDPKVNGPLYALVRLKAGENEVKKGAWWVDDVLYPYTPESFQEKEKPIDDGHGHGPGGH